MKTPTKKSHPLKTAKKKKHLRKAIQKIRKKALMKAHRKTQMKALMKTQKKVRKKAPNRMTASHR